MKLHRQFRLVNINSTSSFLWQVNSDRHRTAGHPCRNDCCDLVGMNCDRRAACDRSSDAAAEGPHSLVIHHQDIPPELRDVRHRSFGHHKMADFVHILDSLLDKSNLNAGLGYVLATAAGGMTDEPESDDSRSYVAGVIGWSRLKGYAMKNEEQPTTRNACLPAGYRLVLRRQRTYRLRHWSIQSFDSTTVQPITPC